MLSSHKWDLNLKVKLCNDDDEDAAANVGNIEYKDESCI